MATEVMSDNEATQVTSDSKATALSKDKTKQTEMELHY